MRNWDYRYLLAARRHASRCRRCCYGGFREEAQAWREWLLRAIAGDPAELQIMYGVAGERRLTEYELPTGCPATRAPARSASATPRPSSSSSTCTARSWTRCTRPRRAGLEPDDARLGAAAHADRVRGGALAASRTRASGRSAAAAQHFTHSKVMAWVAFDRAVKAVEQLRPGRAGRPLAGAARRDPRRRLRARVRRRAAARSRSTTARSELDASAADDAARRLPAGRTTRACVGTVAAIERELLHDGFVQRYTRARATARRRAAARRRRLPRLHVLAGRQLRR